MVLSDRFTALWLALVAVAVSSSGIGLWALVSTGSDSKQLIAVGEPAFYVNVGLTEKSLGDVEVPDAVVEFHGPVIFYSMGDPRSFAAHNADPSIVYRRDREGIASAERFTEVFFRSTVVPMDHYPEVQYVNPETTIMTHISKIRRPSGLYVFPGASKAEVATMAAAFESRGFPVEPLGKGRLAGFFSPVILLLWLMSAACLVMVAWRLGSLAAHSRARTSRIASILGKDLSRAPTALMRAVGVGGALSGLLTLAASTLLAPDAGLSGWGIAWAFVALVGGFGAFAVAFTRRRSHMTDAR